MSIAGPAGTIAGFRSETVTVDGVRLHYWIGGERDGVPVILWHGFLSTGYAWRDVAPALAGAGLSVLIPDMRGYGDSDKPEGTKGYDARALAEECRALVAEFGFGNGKPLIHAAHDMGALPALLWAADHPSEVAALAYVEAPVMLGDVLRKVFAYTPESMAHGSMWWWLLPLAPGVPEALIVGNERAFLEWFYRGEATVYQEAFTPAVVDEYLRTFSGREGVLGSLGIYRAAFTTIEQTEPLMKARIKQPVVAIGGKKGLGDQVGQTVERVAENVVTETVADCGHFVPEECPEVVIRHVLAWLQNKPDRCSHRRFTMSDSSSDLSASKSAIPADDPNRKLSIVDPDDPQLRHIAVVGDTYTVLLSGAQTAGKYCLIDMNVPHCGGPGPHRHDFEEMFHLLDGEIEFTFRGEKQIVKQGMTINIPANAPHFFTNAEGKRARMLCMCAPAGQEQFFLAIGKAVDSRTSPAAKLSKDEQEEFMKKAEMLAPKYRTEMLKP